MRSAIALSTLLGLVSAAPVAEPGSTPPSYGGTTGQVAFKFPLANGFPNVMVPSDTLTAIEKRAHGTLPDGALPTKISSTTATNFKLIAFNEIFEVAYFTSLLHNVTHGSYGKEIGSAAARNIVIKAINAVQAQEQLHALGANAILANTGNTPIKPCEYVFPVDTFDSAIALAATFTDVVLGTLQEAQAAFATNGDSELIPLVGGVIGQEGEQNGFYRNLGGKIPSALPFLTRSAGPFAYSALQMFVVPGSCPSSNAIDIPILPPLMVTKAPVGAKDQTISFSITKPSGAAINTSSLKIVYLNQQNTPIVENISNVKTSGSVITFDALFPGATKLMHGLTLSAVTASAGPFASVDDVASAAKFGPGLIEV